MPLNTQEFEDELADRPSDETVRIIVIYEAKPSVHVIPLPNVESEEEYHQALLQGWLDNTKYSSTLTADDDAASWAIEPVVFDNEMVLHCSPNRGESVLIWTLI